MQTAWTCVSLIHYAAAYQDEYESLSLSIALTLRMLFSLSVDAHLTQLFVQSGGPGLSCRVTLRTEHLLVPVDEVAVAQSDHLHAAIQTIERRMWFYYK